MLTYDLGLRGIYKTGNSGTEFNSDAAFDLLGHLEAIAIAEAIATVRGQRDMVTVCPCSRSMDHIKLILTPLIYRAIALKF